MMWHPFPKRKSPTTLFINASIQEKIDKLKLHVDCEHEWVEHGFGYKCTKCDYYTGMWDELNELIKDTYINNILNDIIKELGE